MFSNELDNELKEIVSLTLMTYLKMFEWML